LEGRVIKSTGNRIFVKAGSGEILECTLKGVFRIKGMKATNPVAVGDMVTVDQEKGKNTGIITRISKRHNYIIRRSTKLSKVYHIIAANIDLAVLMATLANPRTSKGFIDRFLVTAEAYHIPAAVFFNKADIYDTEELEILDEYLAIYRKAGYECIVTSAIRGDNLDKVKYLLQNKVSLISGHSGVGKSALINAIQPGLNLKTGDISWFSNKGKHTTSFAEMHELHFGGFIIDTPGIREFGLVDFKKEEIAERFPEMRELMWDCQFNNCTHIHEPNCAVKKAVENGQLSESRYQSYLKIYNDDYFDDPDYD